MRPSPFPTGLSDSPDTPEAEQETALPIDADMLPGQVCRGERIGPHILAEPAQDAELQTVLRHLHGKPLVEKFTSAIEGAISQVLNGPETGRFDLNSPEVQTGERAAVGVQLEYKLLRKFEWVKTKPLDTVIEGVPVDIKATVGSNWSIPQEAHCQLCICVQIDPRGHRHKSWLIRTHLSWLYKGKGNGDNKRGVVIGARDAYSAALYEWAALPINPLSLLDEDGVQAVFNPAAGQESRLKELFTRLPNTVIPRSVILTVCAGFQDPLRRVRNIKEQMHSLGYNLLCGKWKDQKELATAHGFDLSEAAWVAIPIDNNFSALRHPL